MSTVYIDLMQSLGKSFGLESVTMDDDQSCMLIIAGFHVLFEYFPCGDQLVLATAIGDLPEEGAEDLAWRLLQAQFFFNQTGGATLAVDPDMRFVNLQELYPLQTLTHENFPAIVENFMRVAEHWHAEVCPAEARAVTNADMADGNEMPQSPMPEGMLKI